MSQELCLQVAPSLALRATRVVHRWLTCCLDQHMPRHDAPEQAWREHTATCTVSHESSLWHTFQRVCKSANSSANSSATATASPSQDDTTTDTINDKTMSEKVTAPFCQRQGADNSTAPCPSRATLACSACRQRYAHLPAMLLCLDLVLLVSLAPAYQHVLRLRSSLCACNIGWCVDVCLVWWTGALIGVCLLFGDSAVCYDMPWAEIVRLGSTAQCSASKMTGPTTNMHAGKPAK